MKGNALRLRGDRHRHELGSLNECKEEEKMRLLRILAIAAFCTTTLSAQELILNWYDQKDSGYNADTIVVANPTATSASASVTLLGTTKTVTVPAHGYGTVTFPGVVGGPVFINGPSGGSLVASQLVSYGSNAITTEVNAQPICAAGTKMVLTWYDQKDAGFTQDDVILANPNSGEEEVTVTFSNGAGGSADVEVPAKGATAVSFPGVTGGPVIVTVIDNDPIFASRRTVYYSSFNETNAVPVSGNSCAPNASALLPWYDQYDEGFTLDNVTLVNLSTTDSEYISEQLGAYNSGIIGLSVFPDLGCANYGNFPGHVGGPVYLVCEQDTCYATLMSARTIFDYDIESFNDLVPSYPSENLMFTNYDGDYLLQNIMIANTAGSTTTGTVSVYSSSGSLAATKSFSVGAYPATTYLSFSGVCCGPAFVKSSAPVVATNASQTHRHDSDITISFRSVAAEFLNIHSLAA
jgi:hypothetical protein